MGTKYDIYTVGKMKGTSYEEQMRWRIEIENLIKGRTNEKIKFIHPPEYYNYVTKQHKSEREIKEWELNHVKKCDILIVNLDGINESVGSHFEISTAEVVNSMGKKHIYIIGVGENKDPVHSWIESSLFRHEKDFDNAAKYIVEYLLV